MPSGPDPLGTVSFVKPPISKFIVENSVGGKNQLKNIPKVSDFIAKKIRQYVEKELVVPNGVCFHIPIKVIFFLIYLIIIFFRGRDR